MKIRTCKVIPRVCSAKLRGVGLVAERDFTITKGSRLFAKVLVFKDMASLIAGWYKLFYNLFSGESGNLGKVCYGAVNDISEERRPFSRRGEEREYRVDPNYFCVMGLVQGHLTAEVVAHECMHAGFAYARRKGRRNVFLTKSVAYEECEEKVCYPAGRLTLKIASWLFDAGLYDAKDAE